MFPPDDLYFLRLYIIQSINIKILFYFNFIPPIKSNIRYLRIREEDEKVYTIFFQGLMIIGALNNIFLKYKQL